MIIGFGFFDRPVPANETPRTTVRRRAGTTRLE
jgi:hypothetical protein